jgi:glutamate-1-semialdehyde aminotransferase
MGLVANGIYVLENHVAFTSGAQTDADIDKILEVSEMVLREIKRCQT